MLGELTGEKYDDRLVILDKAETEITLDGIGERQVHLEHGAVSQFAVDPDVAAALLDDAVDGGQTKPRPLAFFLCGKEMSLWVYFENLGYLMFTDTGFLPKSSAPKYSTQSPPPFWT